MRNLDGHRCYFDAIMMLSRHYGRSNQRKVKGVCATYNGANIFNQRKGSLVKILYGFLDFHKIIL